MKHVVDSFSQAFDAITSTFHAASTSDIVSAASRGEIPRKGRCLNGWEYSIHGAGFTVTLPSRGQVHIDWSREGDYFKEYDVAFFMETSGIPERPDLPEIVESLNLLASHSMPWRRKILARNAGITDSGHSKDRAGSMTSTWMRYDPKRLDTLRITGRCAAALTGLGLPVDAHKIFFRNTDRELEVRELPEAGRSVFLGQHEDGLNTY